MPPDGASAPLVLVIEDEPAIARAVAARLESEGFAVRIAVDGPSGVALAGTERPQLVVLDLMLPGLDGLEVCRRIRATSSVPVLMLTARTDETDELVGLGVGADDYLTKPFSPRVLVARVRALLRRAPASDGVGTILRVGAVRVDLAARRVWSGEAEVALTATEFDLLAALASRPDVVHPRERLLREVWGHAHVSGTRTVDSHVRGLRAKLGAGVIRTVHGVGYAAVPASSSGAP